MAILLSYAEICLGLKLKHTYFDLTIVAVQRLQSVLQLSR